MKIEVGGYHHLTYVPKLILTSENLDEFRQLEKLADQIGEFICVASCESEAYGCPFLNTRNRTLTIGIDDPDPEEMAQ